MSSALTVIILGQAYFLNIATNTSTIELRVNKTSSTGEAIRDDYTYTPGVGIHKLHTEPMTWSNAELTCEEEGGHLAILNSVAESEAVAKLFLKLGAELASTRSQYAFIGFRKRLHGYGFITVRGESLIEAGFDVWAPTEPNNLNNLENCGSVWMDGKLNDIDCNAPFNFICELPLRRFGIPDSTEVSGHSEPLGSNQTTVSAIQNIHSV